MKLPRKHRVDQSSATITHTMLLIVVCSGLLAMTLQAQPTWWNSRGAILNIPQVTTNNGVVATNNYYVVNQGQVKQFTLKAVQEMNTNLSGFGAGYALNSMVSNWQQDYATNGYTLAHPKPSDYQAMNLGQLKYIGSLVWTQLAMAGYTNSLPSWIEVNTNSDSQAANIGQLKTVFNFDLTYDSDSNGLPDWWEMKTFGHLGNSTNSVPNGNGLTLLQDYVQGNDPNDFFSQGGQTITPTIAIYSGNNQTNTAGAFLANPLVVKVTNGASLMTNAPVTFYANGGLLTINTTVTTNMGSVLQVTTGTNGMAQAYFQQPLVANSSNIVTVVAGSSATNFVSFAPVDTNPPAPPSDGTVTPGTVAGEIDLTWVNHADNATYNKIQKSIDQTNWTDVVTLTDPTATFYAVQGLTVGQVYFFRIAAGN